MPACLFKLQLKVRERKRLEIPRINDAQKVECCSKEGEEQGSDPERPEVPTLLCKVQNTDEK